MGALWNKVQRVCANLVVEPLNRWSTGKEVLSLVSCQVTKQRTKC